ncbi:phage tail protein [Flavonifractor sp. An92]|uniref:phage tail sheath family protein n=1 Tax=Flavonifractor sp. An92 TaxID=1965666 RepID=UPI000B36575E|nr:MULTISPECIES: phage tail sheath family protein [unclassified Flavonifractor]OUN07314.1 phage tail protein [Flavonifractor sp. An92]OUQ23416.1 phage tail protein [Flavonifractor sp. An135]
MAEYLSPGVYVEEFESGGKPMEGVSTSTAGFIGLAERGPVEGVPQLITNFADFKRTYGGYLSESEFGEYRFLAYAVEHFFINGGSRCFVARVAPGDAKCAQGAAPAEGDAVLTFAAKNPGIWGDNIRVVLTPASKAKTQILEIRETPNGKEYVVKNGAGFHAGDVVVYDDKKTAVYNKVVKSQDNVLTFAEEFAEDVVDKNLLPIKTISTCEFSMEVKYDDQVELYENLSFNVEAPTFVGKRLAKSELVSVSFGALPEDSTAPFQSLCAAEGDALVTVGLSGGSNGSVGNLSAADFIGVDNGAGRRTGIQAFLDNDMVSLMAVPGVVDPNVQLMLVAHCENLGSRFAVLDLPREARKVQDILNHRDMFDTNYAALYHPWLEIFDPLDKKNIAIPPSGSILGIYARSDNTRGVHKAPANEVVRACVGLDTPFNKGEQDILNPKGVNLIRAFPGQGIRVWGARTATSNASWKYVNVRRLFIFIEESIKANTNWAVFEPNDEQLWVRVKRTIDVFLTGLWRNGSLAGSSTSEAFFVDIGRSTMSQDDIDNGRLICVIGVAPVKPAEFVIFRITQKTSEAGE